MSLALADIPGGAAVFVDANIFIYAFSAHPSFATQCVGLLKRIENSDVIGVTSSAVLSEVAHRTMTIEACETFGWPVAGIAQRLRSHAAQLKSLTKFVDAVCMVSKLNVTVVPVTQSLVVRAAEVSRIYGLLSNDALILAVMECEGIDAIATHDADFDSVSHLVRYSPAAP